MRLVLHRRAPRDPEAAHRGRRIGAGNPNIIYVAGTEVANGYRRGQVATTSAIWCRAGGAMGAPARREDPGGGTETGYSECSVKWRSPGCIIGALFHRERDGEALHGHDVSLLSVGLWAMGRRWRSRSVGHALRTTASGFGWWRPVQPARRHYRTRGRGLIAMSCLRIRLAGACRRSAQGPARRQGSPPTLLASNAVAPVPSSSWSSHWPAGSSRERLAGFNGR